MFSLPTSVPPFPAAPRPQKGSPDVRRKARCKSLLSFRLSLPLCTNEISLCCLDGGPMSMTTQRSVSAHAVSPGSHAQTAARKAPIYVNSSYFIIAPSPATMIHVSTRISCVYAGSGYTACVGGCLTVYGYAALI